VAGRAGKPVVFVDKRLSSFDAEQQLIGRKRAGERLTR
jgi:RNase H-fold protein (predicted Holliday junction resolvase)